MAGADVGGDGHRRLGADLGRLWRWGQDRHLAEGVGLRPQRAAQVGVLSLGRAGEALVAVLVGTLLVHQVPRSPSRDARFVHGAVDDAGAFVGAGGYEVVRHRRAIKGAVDHQCPLAIGLPAELGRLVVHHQRVTQCPHGQVEVLGPALGIAPVGSQVPSRPAPGADLCQ